ncbi:hypothetical protein [Paenibacillus abyssi]|uniref:Uncharacterized protein n=1 Tax=Paenibacillus abyssi TaxID=1340531 RepID=A0A917FUV8_9BACL|nr:hypothetical protein [Paenibacillus abyssi]GGG02964.1 hypothetical protein GCM10010916_20060 [Paenibacillus abyssi]
MNYLIALVFVVMIVALVTTLTVGFSKENKKEGSADVQKFGKKWIRLTSLYIVTVVLCLAIFFLVLNS